MIYFCCDERRREMVRGRDDLNGIDYLEVLDDPMHPEDRQRILKVYFLNPLAEGEIKKENVLIEGGERIPDVVVDEDPEIDDKILTVHVNKPGDFSIYTLRLVSDPTATWSMDPMLSAVDFSFKVACPSDFDCRPVRECPSEPLDEPEIDYLAKDYTSFRRLMLDRLTTLMPDWKERNPADLGVALVELLAYVGEHLSYQQDAIATEAYLGTARSRISVRRHARLVDYHVHNGCNARVWVHLEVNARTTLPKGAALLTRVSGLDTRIPKDSSNFQRALAQSPETFETMHEAILVPQNNEMYFYTWRDERCCLPKGTTRATLCDTDQRLRLRAGDVLIFKEELGPESMHQADADPARRHAVRLVSVYPEAKENRDEPQHVLEDPLKLPDPQDPHAPPKSQQIVEIEWHPEDALPFPFCIVSEPDEYGCKEHAQHTSVALGNIVLADHGRTMEESLGEVPEEKRDGYADLDNHWCQTQKKESVPPRFRPSLKEVPLTFSAPYQEESDSPSAGSVMDFAPKESVPGIVELASKEDWDDQAEEKVEWTTRQQDLLNSSPIETHCVVEVESDGKAFLRFGDNKMGKRPSPGHRFKATYRVGNGLQGNIGAEAIAHVVSSEPAIEAVLNPLPARGGIDLECIEDVRKNAPEAFRTQERAVTPADYAEVAERYPGVQKAEATFRWTGSWRTVFLTVDRFNGLPVDEAFKKDMRLHIEKYRLAGHEIEIDSPRYVSLEVELLICVEPYYFRSDILRNLQRIFSNSVLPDGSRGIFHPDNFTFGQPVYLSPLHQAADAVDGVAAVEIIKFQRLGADTDEALKAGKLTLDRLEIARLDNDPNFPEHGVARFKLEGGK